MGNVKAMGLMLQVAKGLLKHGECKTADELGDRSLYVGLSDIGKGAECMRAAVANKVFGSQHPKADDIGLWFRNQEYDKVTATLKKQLILQRGHWFEAGIEQAFLANGTKFFTQLEIDAGFDGVPVLAHLDFVLFGKGAVRVLELKSMANLPEHLYTAYLTQVYGQLGFLAKYWDQARFSIRDGTGQILHSKLSFPELCKKVFGVDMPEAVQDIAIQEDQVKDFYVNSRVNGDWLSTGEWRFRFTETAGRKSLDSKALLDELREIIGEDQVENLIQKHSSQGLCMSVG